MANTETFPGSGQQSLGDTAGRLSDAATHGINSAAGALQSTATSLRNTAASGGETVASLANTAATKLEATAAYMRDHDAKDMVGELEQVVKRNPGASLIAAAAFGFLLGSAIRRD